MNKKIKQNWNRKGATFQIWMEMILFIILFLAIIGVIGGQMNEKYSKNHDLTLGLNLSTQELSIKQYKTDMINDTSQGQSSMTDFGVLKLLSTPKILFNVASIVWSFVNGTFIFNLVNAMHIGVYGTYLAWILSALYVIAIGFILIKLVLRMNP